jgi:hypothetical protein
MQKMETWETILEVLSFLLFIVGIIFRKKPWGLKLLYFSLGMIIAFILTSGVQGAINGWEEGVKYR